MTTMKVKPAKGVKVRDPKTMKHIPEEGINVEESSYWIRRLNAGDIELVKENNQLTKQAKAKLENK